MEVMIVVAIIGILAAIAYPSYREQVARGKRADAKAALLDRAQWLERLYSVSGKYNKLADGTTTVTASSLPSLDTKTADNYTLSFASGSPAANTYTLQMVPTGTMTSDKCGTFSVTNTGAKSVSKLTNADCWDK